jgi:hypothetical protein
VKLINHIVEPDYMACTRSPTCLRSEAGGGVLLAQECGSSDLVPPENRVLRWHRMSLQPAINREAWWLKAAEGHHIALESLTTL